MPTITEDRDQILQVLYRYNHTFDSGDAHAWVDLFTDDASFDVGSNVFTGREALLEFATRSSGGMRHLLANPVIDVNGDTATARAYVFVYRGSDLSVIGAYDDEVVRTGSGWRFAKRVFSKA